MKCDRCGGTLMALLTSMFCPNECDKLTGLRCPVSSCGSTNTEPFDVTGILNCFAESDPVRDSITYHCWKCGHVWNTESQKPETD